MSTLSSTTTAISDAAHIVADVATAPVRVVAAVLDSPRAARRDTRSKELAALRGDGWRPIAVWLGVPGVTVELERDGEHVQVDGSSLAFAAYAARVAVAAALTVAAMPVPSRR